MSEEAKEKAGGGKAAHRKKKGKKVRERGRAFFVLACFLFAQLLLRLSEKVFYVCAWEVRGSWKGAEGVFDYVF